MKTLKIATALAVFSLTGVAAAGERRDLGTSQERAEEGRAPAGTGDTTPLDESAKPTSRQLGEAQEEAEAGESYTSATTPGAATAPTTPGAPPSGIGEAQQIGETGAGYGGEADAGKSPPAQKPR